MQRRADLLRRKQPVPSGEMRVAHSPEVCAVRRLSGVCSPGGLRVLQIHQQVPRPVRRAGPQLGQLRRSRRRPASVQRAPGRGSNHARHEQHPRAVLRGPGRRRHLCGPLLHVRGRCSVRRVVRSPAVQRRRRQVLRVLAGWHVLRPVGPSGDLVSRRVVVRRFGRVHEGPAGVRPRRRRELLEGRRLHGQRDAPLRHQPTRLRVRPWCAVREQQRLHRERLLLQGRDVPGRGHLRGRWRLRSDARLRERRVSGVDADRRPGRAQHLYRRRRSLLHAVQQGQHPAAGLFLLRGCLCLRLRARELR